MAKAPIKKELPVVVDPLTDSLDQLVKTYPALSVHMPSSWFVYNNDGKFKLRLNQACHAYMVEDGVGWDDLITAVPVQDEIAIAYLRMLISGPFKAFSDLIALKNHTTIVYDVETDKETVTSHSYLHITSLEDWPANVLYNFCIATRVPTEHEVLLPEWFRLVKLGYNPTLAFLLSYSTNGKPYHGNRSFLSKGHYWHDQMASWARIIKGDMVAMSKPFKTNPTQSRPTNKIWGVDTDQRQAFAKMTDEAIAGVFGLPIEPPAADPPLKPATRPRKKPMFYGNDIGQFINNEPPVAMPNWHGLQQVLNAEPMNPLAEVAFNPIDMQWHPHPHPAGNPFPEPDWGLGDGDILEDDDPMHHDHEDINDEF